MTLPTGESPVSFSQIRDEFGTAGTDSATAPVRLGQYRRDDSAFTNKNVGELTNLPLDTGIPTSVSVGSSSINVDAFHGKKLNTVVDLHETGSSTFNHNVKTNRFDTGQYDFVGGYRDSLSPSTWQGGKKMIVHINKTFSSTGASNVNDVALTIGDGWPANTEFQIDLGSSAVVVGKGGDGGNGGAGTDESPGFNGQNGGNGTSSDKRWSECIDGMWPRSDARSNSPVTKSVLMSSSTKSRSMGSNSSILQSATLKAPSIFRDSFPIWR